MSTNWKQDVAREFKGDYESIGRAVAREYGVPWSTMWDYKQLLVAKEDKPQQGARILLFDIETAPILAHVWGLWQNNVSLNQIQCDWYILSWSAKWLGEDEVFHDNLSQYEDFMEDPCDDYNIVSSLYDMLNQADIIIGHNVAKFDNKKFKARALANGFPPLANYRTLDTLHIAKQEFALSSNKLDFLATTLGLENKVAHEGHTLWTKCMQGDLEAWEVMKTYNNYDVTLLEDVYMVLRPWFRKHPNVAVYYDDVVPRCTCCGSSNVKLTGGYTYTNLSRFEEMRCEDCGKVSRGAKTTLSKAKRSNTIRNCS